MPKRKYTQMDNLESYNYNKNEYAKLSKIEKMEYNFFKNENDLKIMNRNNILTPYNPIQTKSDLLNILINININKKITTNIYNLIIRYRVSGSNLKN